MQIHQPHCCLFQSNVLSLPLFTKPFFYAEDWRLVHAYAPLACDLTLNGSLIDIPDALNYFKPNKLNSGRIQTRDSPQKDA